MKSIFSIKRLRFLIMIVVTLSLLILSCNNEYSTESTTDSTSVTTAPITHDSLQMQVDSIVTMPMDSMATGGSSTGTPSFIDSSKLHHIGRNPTSVPQEPKPATGTAIVYCPAKMIKGVPSIVNATISKDELSEAFTKFNKKIQELNPDKKKASISNDIKGDTIDLYETMGVILEFDPEDFKQISANDNPTKSFKNKNALEWEWVIKPLHSTRKSIINFKFYYIDPNDSSTNYILQKTISIDVSVDARSYVDKWKDFLLDDPKTTTTAIVIPLVTFLGGFLTGKKKKKDP